jgi:hypothetical protein
MPRTWSNSAEPWFETEGEGEHVLLIGDLTADGETWRGPGRRPPRQLARDVVRRPRLWPLAGRPGIDLDRPARVGRACRARRGRRDHRPPGRHRARSRHRSPPDSRAFVPRGQSQLSGTWLRSDRRQRAILTSLAWTAERATSVREPLGAVDPWLYGPALWRDGTVDRRHGAAEVSHAGERCGGSAGMRDALVAKLWALADADDRDDPDATDAPTLIINGELDPLASVRDVGALATGDRRARVEIIEECERNGCPAQASL